MRRLCGVGGVDGDHVLLFGDAQRGTGSLGASTVHEIGVCLQQPWKEHLPGLRKSILQPQAGSVPLPPQGLGVPGGFTPPYEWVQYCWLLWGAEGSFSMQRGG